jgi:hypothetical protein
VIIAHDRQQRRAITSPDSAPGGRVAVDLREDVAEDVGNGNRICAR